MTLQIRRTTYRGREGFLICGHKRERGWPIRVFVDGDDREYAVRVKERLLAGEERIFEEGRQ